MSHQLQITNISGWWCIPRTHIKKHGSPLLTNLSTSGSVSTWSVRVICMYTTSHLYPAMMSVWFWSQNMLFLHLPQKINHTGIESFPALVLFLELVYHFETKSGGSNPSNCRLTAALAVARSLWRSTDIAHWNRQCTQWKTRSRSWTKTEDRRVLLLNRIPSTVFYKIGTLRKTCIPHWIHPLL